MTAECSPLRMFGTRKSVVFISPLKGRPVLRVEGGSNDEDGEGADPALPPASDDGSAPFHLVRTPQLIASPAPSSSDLSSLIKDRSGSVAAGNHTEGAGNNSSSTVLAATSVSSSTALADSASSSASSIKDPLKWFGVFTSPHLRKSQDNFAQGMEKEIILVVVVVVLINFLMASALPLLIELANLQYNLQTQAAP